MRLAINLAGMIKMRNEQIAHARDMAARVALTR
jgi:hypothetical protein